MTAASKTDRQPAVAQDRHVRQCLREARWVAVLWLIQLVYCTVAMVTLGYPDPSARPDAPNLILGIPAWVVWGLFLPWCVQIVAAWWFALAVLQDDEPCEPVLEGRSDD